MFIDCYFPCAVGCKKGEVFKENIVIKDSVIVVPVAIAKQDGDKDFNVFFEKFKQDSVFQKLHVKFPLKNTFLNSEGMYEVIREDITLRKYHFLDFTKDRESENDPAGFKVYFEYENDTMYYRYRGVDNGIHGDIKFIFENGCWYLVAIEDSST